jgi:hypothetical protein
VEYRLGRAGALFGRVRCPALDHRRIRLRGDGGRRAGRVLDRPGCREDGPMKSRDGSARWSPVGDRPPRTSSPRRCEHERSRVPSHRYLRRPSGRRDPPQPPVSPTTRCPHDSACTAKTQVRRTAAALRRRSGSTSSRRIVHAAGPRTVRSTSLLQVAPSAAVTVQRDLSGPPSRRGSRRQAHRCPTASAYAARRHVRFRCFV